ncbi:MAG: hypothetical protein WAX04_03955 [Oscillospiraceae bacterium]
MKEKTKVKEMTITSQAIGLLGAHVGGVLLSLIFCFGLAALMKNAGGLIIAQILILFVYSFPTYSTMWDYGHRDLNRFNYGHIKRDQLKGFKISLIANIPVFILSLLFILSKFGLFYNIAIVFKLMNAEVWPLINLIQPWAYMNKFAVWQVFLVALLPLIPVLIAGGSYILGNHDFSPMKVIVYKNKKKPTQPKKPPTIKSQF